MTALKELLIPPGSLLVAALAALILQRRIPRAARWILALCLGGLYLLSTPIVSSLALRSLQPAFVEPMQYAATVQAIVVLGGGTDGYAPEYGADNVNARSLVRLRYAARLQRATGLPLLVSGGSVGGDTSSEAQQMGAVLRDELSVRPRWLETRSVDTFGNAQESARLLQAAGIRRVFLVTHAWHIRRARLSFEHAGIEIVPAPTAFASYDGSDMRPADFLPRPSALVNSYYFFHEVIGHAFYVLRARSRSPAPEKR